MGTARQLVLDQLTGGDGLDAVGIDVRPYARLKRQPAKLTLMVRVDDVEAVTGADQLARRYTFGLILLGTRLLTDDDQLGGVDDELDDALELVLSQLDKGITDLVWKTAKRGVYEDTNSPCYLINAELVGTYESEPTP